MPKYSLRLTRLDSAFNTPGGMVDIENSLHRVEDILRDLDNRVTSIDTSGDIIYHQTKDPGNPGWNSFTTEAPIITFNNIIAGRTYRASYSLSLRGDVRTSSTWDDLVIGVYIKLFNSADSEYETLSEADHGLWIDDGTPSDVDGHIDYFYAGAAESVVFKPSQNGKVKLLLRRVTGGNNAAYNGDTAWMQLEELPNYKETTKWD